MTSWLSAAVRFYKTKVARHLLQRAVMVITAIVAVLLLSAIGSEWIARP